MSVPFFFHAHLLIHIQAALWSGPANSLCQLFIIIFANIFLVIRLVHWPHVQADSMPIPNFQYSWPNKESRPESYTHGLFYHCLRVRFGHFSGRFLWGFTFVRSFSCWTLDPRLTLSKVPSRIDMLHRLSGTHHKPRQTASYHVSHIFLSLAM